MKPLNLDNRPCSPVSSNCIVWQGPDISCIKICNGDTISDVVFALATELCTILDQTNVSNYDLTCLGITECGPQDFQALIQLLIDKICEAQGITNVPGKTDNGCPDCIVTVAPCFQVGNQVTMQLLDYVNMIASKVCALIDQIAVINTQITDILIRLDDLENAPIPDTEIPAFTLSCQIGSLGQGTVQFINVTLQEFINNVWCPFFAVLGSTQTLIDAVNAKCISDSDLQLSTGTPYSTNAQWIDDAQYNTIADAINNLWVVVCDIYTYVDSLNVDLNVADTNTIDLTYASNVLTANIVDTGWVNLNGFEFYDTGIGRPQCRRIGNVLHFRGSAVIPLAATPGGTPLVYNNTAGGNTYIERTDVTPAQTGTGSVELDTNAGVSYWNSKVSVIPSSVVSPTASFGFYLDNTYTKTYMTGVRVALISNSENELDLTSTALTTIGVLFITKEGYLGVSVVRDSEETNVSPYGTYYSHNTSHLNYAISHVVKDEFVPNFQALSTIVHSSPLPSPPLTNSIQPLEIDFEQSFTWTVARNAPTTPKNFVYNFSFNGNDVASLGGVQYSLDGLTAFIDPCTLDIKGYVCNDLPV